MVALISALLVLIASYDKNYICPKGLLKKLLMWVGSRSYALYLIHIPAYSLSREIWFRLSPEQNLHQGYFWHLIITAGVILIVLSELNFRLLETPLRRKGAKIAHQMSQKTSGENAKNEHITQPRS